VFQSFKTEHNTCTLGAKSKLITCNKDTFQFISLAD